MKQNNEGERMSSGYPGVPKTVLGYSTKYIVGMARNIPMGIVFGSLALIGTILVIPEAIGFVAIALVIQAVRVVVTGMNLTQEDREINTEDFTEEELKRVMKLITISTATATSAVVGFSGVGGFIIATEYSLPLLGLAFAVGYPIIDDRLVSLNRRLSIRYWAYIVPLHLHIHLQSLINTTDAPSHTQDVTESCREEAIDRTAKKRGPLF